MGAPTSGSRPGVPVRIPCSPFWWRPTPPFLHRPVSAGVALVLSFVPPSVECVGAQLLPSKATAAHLPLRVPSHDAALRRPQSHWSLDPPRFQSAACGWPSAYPAHVRTRVVPSPCSRPRPDLGRRPQRRSAPARRPVLRPRLRARMTSRVRRRKALSGPAAPGRGRRLAHPLPSCAAPSRCFRVCAATLRSHDHDGKLRLRRFPRAPGHVLAPARRRRGPHGGRHRVHHR